MLYDETPDFKPGFLRPQDAESLRVLWAEVVRLGQISVTAPLGLDSNEGGVLITLDPSGFATQSSTGPSLTIPTDVCDQLTAHVVGEVPSGTINGSNKVFTLANTPLASGIAVYVAGLRVASPTVSGATITLATAPTLGQSIYVDYYVASPALPVTSGVALVQHVVVQLSLLSLPVTWQIVTPFNCLEDPQGCCSYVVSTSVMASGFGGSGISACCSIPPLQTTMCATITGGPFNGTQIQLNQAGLSPGLAMWCGCTAVSVPGCTDASGYVNYTTGFLLIAAWCSGGNVLNYAVGLIPGGTANPLGCSNSCGGWANFNTGWAAIQTAGSTVTFTCPPPSFSFTATNLAWQYTGSTPSSAAGCNTTGMFTLSIVAGGCAGGGGGGGGGGIISVGHSSASSSGASVATLTGGTFSASGLMVVNVMGYNTSRPTVTYNGHSMTWSGNSASVGLGTVWQFYYAIGSTAQTGAVVVTAVGGNAPLMFNAVYWTGLTSNALDRDSGNQGSGGQPVVVGLDTQAPTAFEAAFLLQDPASYSWNSPFTGGGLDVNMTVGGHNWFLTEGRLSQTSVASATATLAGTTFPTWGGVISNYY
jgi:hypothetical protein